MARAGPIIIIVILVAALGIYALNQQGGGLRDSERDKVPKVSLENYEGNTVSLSDFSGTPLVINSWATWCPFCVDELPDFATVQKEFEGQVVFIVINRQESLDDAKRFSDNLGVTDDMIFLLDPDDSFYRAIGGFSMPETIFVNGEGNIIEHKRGPMDAAEAREKVRALLE